MIAKGGKLLIKGIALSAQSWSDPAPGATVAQIFVSMSSGAFGGAVSVGGPDGSFFSTYKDSRGQFWIKVGTSLYRNASITLTASWTRSANSPFTTAPITINYTGAPPPPPSSQTFDIVWNPPSGSSIAPSTPKGRVVAILQGRLNGDPTAFAASGGSYYFDAPSYDGSGINPIGASSIIITADTYSLFSDISTADMIGLTSAGPYAIVQTSAAGHNNESYLIINPNGPGVGGLPDPTTEHVTVKAY